MAIDTIKASAILDGAVDTADIANGAVTSAKLDTNIDIGGTLDVTGTLTADSTLDVSSNLTVGGTTTLGDGLNMNGSSGDRQMIITNTGTTSSDNAVFRANAGASYYSQMFQYGSGESYLQTNGTSLEVGTVSGGGALYLKSGNTIGISMNNSGAYTSPKNPMFRVQDGYHTGSNPSWVNITNGNFDILSTWDINDFNRESCFNTSTGLFTAPIGGFYFFSFQSYTRGVTYGDHMYKGYTINSTVYNEGHILHYNDNGNADYGDNYTFSRYLNANDTVGVWFRATSSNSDMQYYSPNNVFQGFLVG